METLLSNLIDLTFVEVNTAYVVSLASVQTIFSQEHFNKQDWQGLVYINPLARSPLFVLGVFAVNVFLQVFQKSASVCAMSR